MNKLKIIKSVFVSVLIGIMFATLLPNAYSEYSNRMISTIDSPYEIPDSPSLIVDTEQENVEQSVDKIYNAIKNKIK